MRVRYLTAKGFKNFEITDKDEKAKTFLVQRKSDCQDHEEITFETQKYQKVTVVNQYCFCTCMSYFNTGLPCEHALLVAISERLKFLVHSRWSRKYEKIMFEMEDNSRNERIDKMHEQLLFEQKEIYAALTKVPMPRVTGIEGNDDEEEVEQKILQVALTTTIYKEDVRITVSD